MRTLHLIESARKGHTTNGLPSFLSMSAHAAFVLVALYATGRETMPREDEPDVRVYFAPEVANRAPVRAAPPTPPPATTPNRPQPAVPPMVAAPVEIAFVIPTPDVRLGVPGPAEAVPPGQGIDRRAGVPGAPPSDRIGPYAVGEVESPAAPLSKAAPEYPARARSLGSHGTVTARFVVGADGRVEDDIDIVHSTGPDFTSAVREFLRRTRYRAARVGGRSVRQLVEQRFVFELR